MDFSTISINRQYCYECYRAKDNFNRTSRKPLTRVKLSYYNQKVLFTDLHIRSVKRHSPYIILLSENGKDFSYRCIYHLAEEYTRIVRGSTAYGVKRKDAPQVLLNPAHPYYLDQNWQMQFEKFLLKKEEYESSIHSHLKAFNKYPILNYNSKFTSRQIEQAATIRALDEELHIYKPEKLPYFNRFDIVEAYYIWYLIHDIKNLEFFTRFEAPRQIRVSMTGVENLTDNGFKIYEKLCKKNECEYLITEHYCERTNDYNSERMYSQIG